MVVVSHLFFFLRKYFRGRCDSGESHRPLSGTIYFPTAPSIFINMQENSYKERILPLTPTKVCFFFFKLLPFASSVYYEIYRDYDQLKPEITLILPIPVLFLQSVYTNGHI